MGHSHTFGNTRRVQIALALTASFMFVEVVGGLVSGSLALLADAGHMLTDTMSLALALVAFRLSDRPADAKRSFGYSRFQILAAFVNGISLLMIVIWILIEAADRLMNPSEVMGTTMLAVAGIGLAVNIASFTVLHGGDQHNLNIRGASLHVLGDMLGSVAAIVAALVIMTTGWMPIDPILSVAVSALILRSAWLLIRKSAHILLEGSPDDLDESDIKDRLIAAVPGVVDVHHIHIWGLTQEERMLTLHLKFCDEPQDATRLVRQAKKILAEEFDVSHSTIEVEIDECSDA